MLITCLGSEIFYFLDTNGRFLRNFNTTANAKLTYADVDQTGRVIAIAMNLKKYSCFSKTKIIFKETTIKRGINILSKFKFI